MVSLLISFFSQGQDVITVEDKITNERIGDCMLKRILATHDGRHGSKTFEVDVPSDGTYYLGTIISTPIEAGKPKPIQLLVDGKQINESELLSKEIGFQNVSLRDSASKLPLGFFLAKGMHRLKFDLDGPAIPLIDGIRLAQKVSESTLTDVNESYIDTLKQNKLEADYLKKKKKANGGRQLANPEGNYYHDVDLNLTYTYSTAIYFTAGTTVTFETRNSNTDPVMYLFQRVPSGYYINISWSNDDSNGSESSITCTIPYTGTYELMVRAFSSTSPGVSDIYQNGTLYSSQVPVAGKLFGFGGKNALTNTFTCNTSKIPYVNSDTKLYITPNSSIDPIRDFNDDYYQSGGGDYNWSLDSRVKRNFSGASMNAIVSAYSTSTAGVYDFYGNCEFSNITGSTFPNLKADDAIQTAPFNSNYNCASWGGGITSFWFWPDPWSSHSWPGSTYLDSFDKFYGNNPPRYAGAFTYTRSDADASNGVVALWANSSNYQHISVRKPGNDQPHGYDWESKPGQLMRTMHPRDGLQGQSYGSIVAYYRYTGSNARIGESDRLMTLEESIEEGLSKMDAESFTDDDNRILARLVKNLSDTDVNQFNNNFEAWQGIWSSPEIIMSSDPRSYADSKEYEVLVTFCKKLGETSLPLLIEQFKEHDLPLSVLIADVLLPGNEQLLADVKKENLEHLYDQSNVYIVRSSSINCLKFLRRLLVQQANSDAVAVEQNYPNTFSTSTTFSFYLPQKSTVTIELYSTQSGQLVKRVADEVNFESGWQTFRWINDSVSPGTYLYRILVNGKATGTKRLLIK